MRNTFNSRLLLWGLGVIQPATMEEVIDFLKVVYFDVSHWPDSQDLEKVKDDLLSIGYIFPVHKGQGLYSLTAHANQNLDVKIRRLRDKSRITLLRSAFDASLKRSGVASTGLDGDSPSVNVSTTTQEARPKVSTEGSPLTRRSFGRNFWPRVIEQLNLEVGLTSRAPDTFFKYYSFPNITSVHKASNSNSTNKDLTLSELALCIGVSPRLITSFIHKPQNHYRTFSLPKKGGGERKISSPRYFLKTIQYWLNSYFLIYLRVHDACHAYEKGRSIITNARNHVGRRYVANMDIEDYFGNISAKHVFETLLDNKFGMNLAMTISRLVTLDNGLPQGAPTSPSISNAFLHRGDEAVTAFASERGVVYTRYADDITLSGDSLDDIKAVMSFCAEVLDRFGLKVNSNKTRIASDRASQVVTGVVVNEKVQPPRKFQRNVRAMFHSAYKSPEEFVDRRNELMGYISYLSSFDELFDSRHIRRYKMILAKVNAYAKKNANNDSSENVDL